MGGSSLWDYSAQQQDFSRRQQATEGKNNNSINFKKAFILFFFLSSPFSGSLHSAGNETHVVCVCVPVSAISTWSHGGCKDPPVATSFLQTAGQEMSCPNNAFPEGNAKAHTHLNTTESKNQLNFKARHTWGKQALLGFFFVWGCHGVSKVKCCRVLGQYRNEGS